MKLLPIALLALLVGCDHADIPPAPREPRNVVLPAWHAPDQWGVMCYVSNTNSTACVQVREGNSNATR